jgi:hypothetical protein
MDVGKLISKTLKDNDGSLSLKKLKKAVVSDDVNKTAFKAAWSALVEKGRVMEADGMAVRISSSDSKKRKKGANSDDDDDQNDDNDGTKKSKAGDVSGSSGGVGGGGTDTVPGCTTGGASTGGSRYPNLWATGEQAWRDGTIDQDYLDTNPDNITR